MLAGDGCDAPVVSQTVGLDTVPEHGRANVADRAWRKASDARSGRRVHDETFVSVARAWTERAALLSTDSVGVGACLRSAVVDSTKGMGSLMCNHLPLGRSADNDVCTSHGL